MNTESYAKYKFEITKDICNIQIDKEAPKCMIAYSTKNLTNDDVIIYIRANEEMQEMDGWTLEDNGKKAYKTIKENEAGEVKIFDLAGNKTKINYNIDWIDKEAPKIIGIENNEVTNKFLNLEYTDNIEIAEIIKNKLGDLEVYVNYFYQNIPSGYEKGFDKDSITVTIRTMPQGAEEFSYYINGELKTITKDKSYTFENLNEGELYEFYAETTINGEKNKSKVREQRTSMFDEMKLSEEGNYIKINGTNIKENVNKIRIAAWNEENNQDDIKNYYIENINNENFEYKVDIANHNNLKGVYSVHIYMYDINGNELSMYPGRYEFIEDRDGIEYEFDRDGTYEVIAKDTANNETTKIFKIDTVKPLINIETTKENNNCIINNIEIVDESNITKVEFGRNNNIEKIIENEEILNSEIENYVFENINNDNLFINIYDEAGNCQIVKI